MGYAGSVFVSSGNDRLFKNYLFKYGSGYRLEQRYEKYATEHCEGMEEK